MPCHEAPIHVLHGDGQAGHNFILTHSYINISLLNQICQFTYFPTLYLLSSFQPGQTSLLFLQGTVCALNFKRCLCVNVSEQEICFNYNTVTLASVGNECLGY